MAICLIVDDNHIDAKDEAEIAKSLGFETKIVESGSTALSFCDKQMPEVIILDILIPVMDGKEFLRNLRGKLGGQRPFVIICTTSHDIETIQDLKKYGISGYIVKPYPADKLINKLKESGFAKK